MTFTGNRAMLSKSSSNLLNRNSSTNVNTNLRPCEIELDESSVDESLDKFQRSKSSENRNGLKISKTFSNENDEENRQNVSAVGRRKSSNGNLLETEQEKMSLPVQRYLSNNVNAVVQSASSASVNNNGSKSKPPVSIPVHIDRRDSNSSNSETSRFDFDLLSSEFKCKKIRSRTNSQNDQTSSSFLFFFFSQDQFSSNRNSEFLLSPRRIGRYDFYFLLSLTFIDVSLSENDRRLRSNSIVEIRSVFKSIFEQKFYELRNQSVESI